MAKTRLIKADREAIRAAVIAHRFKPMEADHEVEGHALVIQSRARAYGEFLPTMEGAADGAFPASKRLRVNVDGRRIDLLATAPVRVFYAHEHGFDNYILKLPASDKLGARILAWGERGEDLKAERRHLVSVTDATLSAFNTFDDLLTGWPEAEQFIFERWRSRPDYKANVPAVALRDLSAALGLPPEEREAA